MKRITQFLVLMFSIFLCYGVRAQVATYSFSHQIGTFTPNSSTATRVASIEADTQVSTSLPIGFTFGYCGVNYTNFFMSSNGNIQLGTTSTSTASNDLSAANAANRPIIAPLWDDLDGRADVSGVLVSRATYEVTGTAPNRILTIEWLNWEWYWSSTDPTISFQVKLYETTNVIEFVYRQESGVPSTSCSASIGINDPTGTGFLNLDTDVTIPVVSNNVVNNIKIRPVTNQIFRFTPPSCFYTGAITVSNITQTGADLTLSAPSTFPIEVYVGQNQPSATTAATAVIPAGVTTVTIPGLNHSKLYDVYIRYTCPGTTSLTQWAYIVDFYTLCGVLGNFFEGFENTATGSTTNNTVPHCWTYIKTGTSTSLYGYTSTTAKTGTKGFYMYRSSTASATGDLMLISPETNNLGNGTKQLRFSVKRDLSGTSYDGELKIYSMSGKTATSSKVLLTTIIVPDDAQWKEYILPLGATTDDYFAFAVDFPSKTTYLRLDDIYYEDLMPCVFPMNIVASAVTSTTATISWSPSLSTGVTTYEYELRSVGMPTISGTVTGTTANVTGLAPGKNYEVYVRSVCGTTEGSWTSYPIIFSTLCGVVGNFYEGFDTTATGTSGSPVVPLCWAIVDDVVTSGYAYVSTTNALSPKNGLYMYKTNTTGNVGQNLIVISPETDNLGNGTKQVRFSVRSSSTVQGTHMLEIVSSNGQASTSTFNTIATLDINHTTFQEYIVVLPNTTDDYFGFRLAHNGKATTSTLYIDDVYYEKAPTCKPIDVITLVNISKKDATVSWADLHNGSVPYEIEVRENGNPGDPNPIFKTITAAGVLQATITGLLPNTTYNIYVRAICDPTDKGKWSLAQEFKTLCDYPDFISAPGVTVCGGGIVDLTATYSAGTVEWYDAAVNGNLIHTGANFKTPLLASSTSYWVKSVGNKFTQTGLGQVTPIGSSATTASNYGLVFDAKEDFVLQSVDVYLASATAGNLVLNLTDNNGAVLQTLTIALPAGGTAAAPIKHTVNLGLNITGGKIYRLIAVSSPSLIRDSTGSSFPYSLGKLGSITSGYINGTSQTYYYFYNWSVEQACETVLTEVPVTVIPGPVFSLSTDKVVSCEGDMSSLVTITSGASSFDQYDWIPSTGVTGDSVNGWQFSSNVEQEYTLLASQSNGDCKEVKKVRILVNKKPEANPNLPLVQDVCKGVIKELDIVTTLPSDALIGDGRVLTSKASAQSAFVQSAKFSKQQYIYRATELFAKGVNGSGFITDLALDIANSASSLISEGYEIKMMLIPDTSFSKSDFYTGNFATVYSKVNHSYSNTGLQKITLDNPFFWDGKSHILVEINQKSAGGGLNAETYYTPVTGSSNSVGIYATSDVDDNLIKGTTSSNRLNLTFYFGKTEVTWAPSNNLYTDAAATNPYVLGTKVSKVYYMSNQGASQIYKATLFAPNGCTSIVDFTMNTVDLGIPIVQDHNLCKAGSVTDIVVSGNLGGSMVFYSSPTSTNKITTISKSGTYYVQFEKDGCSSPRVPFNVTILDLQAPTVQFTQVICDSGTVADLKAKGVNGSIIKWYDSLNSTLELLGTQQLVDNTTYYATQTFGNCESSRVAVLVDINPIPPALSPVNNVVTICGALNYGSIDLKQVLGSDLVWYSTMTSQQPLNNNDVATAGTYFVSQKVNGCESARVPVTLDVQANIPAPTAVMQNVCGGGTVAQLVAQILPNATAVWYDNANSTVPLLATDNLINATYYVAQKIGNCLSSKIPVAVRVINTSAPSVAPFILCEGATVDDLDIPLTSGVTYKWYSSNSGTTELPSNYVLKSGFYFVSRMQNNCESIKTQVQITVNSRPISPTGLSPQTFADYAEISNIIMDQPNVIWYLTYDDAIKGNNPLPKNMPLVDGQTYYAVLIGVNGCPSIPTPIKIGIYLGTNDLDLTKLKYYPNPVDNILNINYIENIVKVEIFDLRGRLILDKRFDDTNVNIDLTSLSSGTYMVNIKTKESAQFVKIVKK